jgi:hypothetical protein
VRGGNPHLTIDERAAHLFVTLEGLHRSIVREETSGNSADSEELRSIQNIFYDAKRLRPHLTFRDKVLEILAEHGLEDAQVMDPFYASGASVTGQRTWVGAIKYYRDKITHEGYLDFRSGTYDVMELQHITQHVYDIIARICLVRLGYQRTYQPVVLIDQDPRQPNWVGTSVTPADLGYGHGD